MGKVEDMERQESWHYMIIRDFTKFIKQYFGKADNLIGVEVGVWQGANALSMYQYLLPKKLILVDAWNDNVESVEPETNQEHLLSTFQKFKDNTNVLIIRGMSVATATILKELTFDFVYLDGCHHAEQVALDINHWYPLVKDGGVLGGHDYNMDGIFNAVNERFTEISFAPKPIPGVTWQGIDWWVVK